jgi:hypothetical protein
MVSLILTGVMRSIFSIFIFELPWRFFCQ